MVLTKIPGPLIVDDAITSAKITDTTITNAKMAVDPSNASNLSSGDVPLAQLGNVPDPDLTAQKGDIALLAFKTQANGNLAKYNLVDQTVDAFEDATGISASDSTNEMRNSAGKYYYGGSASGSATGGTVTTHGSYTVHSFLTDDDFVTPGAHSGYAVLMVGGGASGGSYHAGGGGAGGVIQGTGWTLAAGTYPVVVGDGGVTQSGNGMGSPATATGNNGVNTTFASQTALGGGGGGNYQSVNSPNPYSGGATGGSGGGACGGQYSSVVWDLTGAAGSQPAPSGQPGTGHAFKGGDSSAAYTHSSGGGGGAGAVGQNASYPGASGNGGDGIQNDYRTGSNVYYGGGGGGGRWSGTQGEGGAGGGGAGSGNPPGGSNANATPGTANTGGGGGGMGGNSASYSSGAGGSGIVVIRYTTGSLISEGANMTLESITTTTATAPTKGDLVFTYTNGAGTAVVGTNITAEYSADAGSTWTDFGIGAGDVQGTTGGHTIVTKNNVALTSTSGTSMRYRIKTLVQSVSLATRIHAVSLGWS
jgi:hypothetical protein